MEGIMDRVRSMAGRMPTGPNHRPADGKSSALPLPRQESQEGAELTAEMCKVHDEWAQSRRAYEPVWYTCIAMTMGQQWSYWNPSINQLVEPRVPSWKRRITENRILPTLRTQKGKLDRGQHQPMIIPEDQTETAFADARVGLRACKALYQMLQLDDPISESIDWMLQTGNGFLKVGWDATLGDRFNLPDLGPLALGEVCVDSLGPFSLFFPPDFKGFRYPADVIHASLVPVQKLKDLYGERASSVTPDSSLEMKTEFWESRALSLVSPLSFEGAVRSIPSGNSAYTMERWTDPELLDEEQREQFPNGRVVVMTYSQRLLLSVHQNPYITNTTSGSRLPFVDMRSEHPPGRYYGQSDVEQLVPIQTNYNEGRSEMVEARRMCTKPSLNIEQGHGIVKFTNAPGQVWERRQGSMPPSFAEPPKMSDYHVRDILEGKEAFQEVAQLAESSRGQLPFAGTAGITVHALQEADNTPLAAKAKAIASAESRMYTMILARIRQFYTEPRMLAYVGENSEEDVFEFFADRHPTPLRAVVSAESVFPEGRGSKRAAIGDALKMGVLNPIQNRGEVLRLMELGDSDTIWENADLDRQNASRENRLMAGGEALQVQVFDDDEIHVQCHDRLRKSPQFRGLHPMIQEQVNAHVEEHLGRMADRLGAAGELTGAPDMGQDVHGAPPEMPVGPGGPPGPVKENSDGIARLHERS